MSFHRKEEETFKCVFTEEKEKEKETFKSVTRTSSVSRYVVENKEK